MTIFADRLQSSIERSKSYITAGFDPVLESLPPFILEEAQQKCLSDEDAIIYALRTFYGSALEEIHTSIAAVKPNLAFFEQYGLAGIRAYVYICDLIRNYNLPVIADAKRGDIGSTAQAYSRAYLSESNVFGTKKRGFDADALTVNPYLGFDTVEVYLKDCIEYGKGIFVLVKTSNPGSKHIQDLIIAKSNALVNEQVATWINENADKLLGQCRMSGLGAVVGATYPEEAANLRKLMPSSFFLIPGMGAQGGTAESASKGFASLSSEKMDAASIINISRGIFSDLPAECKDITSLKAIIGQRVKEYNLAIQSVLQK